VKFSLFFEMQMSDPTPRREAELFRESVQQAVLADELGYHCVWAVEHHGLYEYSHCSAPEVFLSYVAARTRRIRIGHGCTLLPYRYNHPIRVAERLAVLDILSEGRVNWGTAKSITRVEQDAFQIDRATLHAQWREAIEMIPKMWSSDIYSHKGEFFDIPPTCIVPKPVQKPNPPIFAACSKPENAVEVGQMGIGALNLAIYFDEMLADRVRAYRRAVATCSPIAGTIVNHFACNPGALVLKNDYDACRHGLRGSRFFVDAMLHYSSGKATTGRVQAPRDFPSNEDVEKFRTRRNASRSQLSSVIGDPIAARESVQRFVEVGVDELIFVMQTGTTPDEIVRESIRTMAEEVMPYFSDGPRVQPQCMSEALVPTR
jgi:alkanesulfonate monooxygenase SsuD/methylene tetrahydromethanopterin reductase-like flavin-dependent oxidoreductase (luciferase family)